MRYVEITHWGHPQHKLKLEHTEVLFKCDGCKEVGIGSCYKCKQCDYDLHVQCALPSSSICHPFYTKCCFQFMVRPPGSLPRYCNACEKDVSGCLYHCRLCGFDLHPCCATLPMVLDDGEVKLYLYRKVSSPCHRCGRKGRSWTYRSACKTYNLHVACVKEMLLHSWHDLYLGKESRMRIPSLKRTLLQRRSSKGKGCEVAALALQFVISALLGDPTSLIVALVASFMST